MVVFVVGFLFGFIQYIRFKGNPTYKSFENKHRLDISTTGIRQSSLQVGNIALKMFKTIDINRCQVSK